MNYRMALFRGWVVLSVLWVGFWLAAMADGCFDGTATPLCPAHTSAIMYTRVTALVLGVPALVLALGYAALWIAAGLRKN